MKVADKKLLLSALKGMILIALACALCRFTKGVGAGVIAGIAVVCAFTNRLGFALIAYILFPFMVIMSPFVLPKAGMTGMILRVAPVAVTIGMLVAGSSRHGRHALPVGVLWFYLLVACVSSMGGYYPEVSYMKIVNFAILLLGLQLGFRNIDKRPRDIETVRIFLLSMISFMIWGSLATLPFPGIAYSTVLGDVAAEQGLDEAAALVRQGYGGTLLFAGITNQSQCLGVMLPCCLAWTVCDMLFVERRITIFHSVTIAMVLPMLYMCRSRTAFLSATVAISIIYFYCMQKVKMSQRLRRTLRTAMTLGGVAVFCVCCVMEVRNQSISKWLRKTEDVSADTRGMKEAFTASRMGKIEENLADFKQNPVLGMGFQVNGFLRYQLRGVKGLILSAPIEKSVLPVMVLGETGLVGGVVFAAFLLVFYGTCIKKRYFCTLAMMSVFLVTNMSEATFFSPGGIGGTMWVMCGGGGFTLDMIVLHRQRYERFMREQAMLAMGQQNGYVPR